MSVNQNTKIPKIIHYCWFGGNPLPELAKKCIESWKRYCPDYEIREWNESNFDLNCCEYVKEAYQNKKWAFVSDVARLYALYHYGGIYMDTDVEVIKPLDSLLEFEAISGFESETEIPTGLMGCAKGHPMFREFLEDYDHARFVRSDGSLDLTTNVKRITAACRKYGLKENNTLQTVNGFTLLPRDYLCPKDSQTKELHITENTRVIHHFDGSWVSEDARYAAELTKKWKRLPGGSYVARFVASAKYFGIKAAVDEFIRWMKRK